MIKLIKTITKNGDTKKYPMLAASQTQADELLKDSRFALDEEPKKEPTKEVKKNEKV